MRPMGRAVTWGADRHPGEMMKERKGQNGGHGSRNEFPAMSFLWALILVSLLDVPRRLQHNNSLYFLLPLLSLESYPQLNHPIKSLKLDLYWRSFCKFLEVKNARAGKMLQIPRSSISCQPEETEPQVEIQFFIKCL